jgi:hypothetical protein
MWFYPFCFLKKKRPVPIADRGRPQLSGFHSARYAPLRVLPPYACLMCRPAGLLRVGRRPILEVRRRRIHPFAVSLVDGLHRRNARGSGDYVKQHPSNHHSQYDIHQCVEDMDCIVLMSHSDTQQQRADDRSEGQFKTRAKFAEELGNILDLRNPVQASS